MKFRHPKEFLPVAAVLICLPLLALYVAAAAGWLKDGTATFKIAEIFRFTPKPIVLVATSTPPVAPPSDHSRLMAVMLDNHPDAMPQSGLKEALYVHEALVEGGLTRVMAIFGSATATKIGPVRSARPYFLDWAREYDAVYVHVGGSDEALRQLALATTGLDDVNEFRFGSSFWRDRARYAPHNTYTSTANLRALIAKRGWQEASEADAGTFRSKAVPQGELASRITVEFGNGRNEAEFTYDPATKTYHRDDYDAAPTTLVLIDVPVVKVPDPQKKGLIGLQTVGEGSATLFRDGIAFKGTWKKDSKTGRIQVVNENGYVVPYAYGQIWIVAYAGNKGGSVSYEVPTPDVKGQTP